MHLAISTGTQKVTYYLEVLLVEPNGHCFIYYQFFHVPGFFKYHLAIICISCIVTVLLESLQMRAC